MDAVFRALADPTRRELLDELFRRDGQSLGELEERLPMTRFGVMKHLAVLERAGLITTRRQGRQKLHFLNPVPIRQVHDRWVSKYAEPWAAMLSALKEQLEDDMTTDATDSGRRPWTAGPTEKVFEIYIRTTPERLWEAITDPQLRQRYSFGMEVHSDWRSGSEYELSNPQAGKMAIGENLEVDPPRRLVQSFTALWSEEVRAEGRRVSRGRSSRSATLPADGHPRSDARGRPQRDLRRLAADPVRAEDAAGDRRGPHHSGLSALHGRGGGRAVDSRPRWRGPRKRS